MNKFPYYIRYYGITHEPKGSPCREYPCSYDKSCSLTPLRLTFLSFSFHPHARTCASNPACLCTIVHVCSAMPPACAAQAAALHESDVIAKQNTCASLCKVCPQTAGAGRSDNNCKRQSAIGQCIDPAADSTTVIVTTRWILGPNLTTAVTHITISPMSSYLAPLIPVNNTTPSPAHTRRFMFCKHCI